MAKSFYPKIEYQQERLLNSWCRSRGITADDLVKHPCVDDITILLRIKEDLGHMMNTVEQAAWGGHWSSVYHKKKRLTDKSLRRIEGMVKALTARQQALQATRHKIKSIRHHAA